MPSIRALPPEVAAQLKASVNITSLHDAVLGLIENSLDAESTRINVDVDFARASCTVEDDGHGIVAAEFEADGLLGRPFHTSKYSSPRAQRGVRGAFLASLGGLSVMNICSRPANQVDKAALTMYRSERLPSSIADLAHLHLCYRKHGTRVSVQDLFGGMPVRVRQRPYGIEHKLVRDRMWKALCRSSLALLLASAADVSFTMKAQDKDHLFRLQLPLAHIGPATSPLTQFKPAQPCHLLTQACDMDHISWSSWVQTAAHDQDVTIRGLISKCGSPSRDMQFLSMGIHPLPADGSWACLYEVINNTISMSTFGSQGKEQIALLEGRAIQDMIGEAEQGKSVYRHAMFYIRIDQRPAKIALSPRPGDLTSRDISKISDMLEALFVEFLKNQGHSVRKRPRRIPADTGILALPLATGQDETIPDPSNDHTRQTRMKFGIAQRVKGAAAPLPSSPCTEQGSKDSFSTFDEAEALTIGEDIEPDISLSTHKITRWVDPRNNGHVRLDPRTGMAEDNLEPDIGCLTQNARPLHKQTRLTLGEDGTATLSHQAEQWAQDLVMNWKTPAFGRIEEPIRTVHPNLEHLAHFKQDGLKNHAAKVEVLDKHLNAVASRITREDLQRARVLGQVDRKFILASVQKDQSGMEGKTCLQNVMFIIDQHAADERVQVENLLQELCQPAAHGERLETGNTPLSGVATVQLDKAIQLEMSFKEAYLLERHMDHFAAWGILFTMRDIVHTKERSGVSRGEGHNSRNLTVLSLPPAIIERCHVDQKLLRNILVKEAWARDESGIPNPAAEGALPAKTHWLHRIHDCPAAILDMVNSRACRSAIMFNDELSRDDCDRLVRKLAQSTFPFQCAHGRPSTVPLSSTTVFEAVSCDGEQSDFGRAYREWQ